MRVVYILALVILSSIAVSAEPIINEIMYDPAGWQGRDADMEWIELYSNEEINLSSYYLDGKKLNGSFSGYAIIARNKTNFTAYYGGLNCNIFQASMLLANKDDRINLSKLGYEDVVNYSPKSGGDGNGKTLERVNNSREFKESLVVNGTPCRENSVNVNNALSNLTEEDNKTMLIRMDFNSDGEIDFPDFLAFALRYGAEKDEGSNGNGYVYNSSTEYNGHDRMDFNNDDVIGFADYLRFAKWYGWSVNGDADDEAEELALTWPGIGLPKLDGVDGWSNNLLDGIDNNLQAVVVVANAQSIDYNGLRITGLMANPNGDDNGLMPDGEWIEVYNSGSSALDLTGLKLKDYGGHVLLIKPENVAAKIINPYSSGRIYRNGGGGFSLNNEGYEEVVLLDNNDNEIDKASYTGSKEGVAWVKVNNAWIMENLVVTASGTSSKENDDGGKKSKTKSVSLITNIKSEDKKLEDAVNEIATTTTILEIAQQSYNNYESKDVKAGKGGIYFFGFSLLLVVLYLVVKKGL